MLPADSELYHASGAGLGYDGLNRMTNFSRGVLSSSSGSVLDTIASPSHSQSWALDAVGNQTRVVTDGVTQSKAHNQQNQTTSVSTPGASSTLAYDGNGSTTADEQGRHETYDAWGDLVSVAGPTGSVIESYRYDALGRRIVVRRRDRRRRTCTTPPPGKCWKNAKATW